MKFEYFRFLLTPVHQQSLFSSEHKTREEIINSIFAQDNAYTFTIGKAAFGMTIDFSSDGLVRTKLGKQTIKNLHASPDQGFELNPTEDWPFCILLINLNDEKSSGMTEQAGQVMAFSVNKAAITNPTNCLQALAKKINETIESQGFHLTINPIPAKTKNFWAVAEKHKDNIRKVVLTYTPPNIFNLESNLEEDLKKANENFNITSSQIILENDAGHLELPEENELLKETAKYLDLGSGSYKFHLTRSKRTISSKDGVKSESFEETEITSNNPIPSVLMKTIRKVLGIEND